MAVDITKFYQVFFEESKEHLDVMEGLLLKLNVENPDLEQLNAIFRAAHSIKGGSATFGFHDITAVTHLLENLLDRLRKKELQLQTEMIDVFLQAADVIKLQLNSYIDGAPADEKVADAVTNKLFMYSADSTLVNIAEKPKEAFDDGFGFFEPINTPTKETEITEPPIIDRRVGDRRDERSTESSSIRVNVQKVNQLINLVGELVITEAMLTQCLSHAPADLLQVITSRMAQLERNTRDLQEAVMSMRMMPIGTLFSRYPRLVRDLASKLKKEVELITVGEETELDKGLIERIADPLTHLIRNSLDHGIETPEARKAAGKPAKGSITLTSMHQDGGILIEVADDGSGLDREHIIKKAKERGIPIPSNLTDDGLWDIISQPGFSTADAITDVSGRGVGMDVVNRNIADMGGHVSVTSITGQGCKISIQLPLTLAILDGMTVALGENVFVIPLNMIIETMQPKTVNLKSIAGGGAMVHIRDEYLPIIAMYKAFNIATKITEVSEGMLVLVEVQGKKAALLFDDLVGQQQVVIKSLETNFRKVRGISGATILGDGTVALIVDVATIMKLGQTTPSNQDNGSHKTYKNNKFNKSEFLQETNSSI